MLASGPHTDERVVSMGSTVWVQAHVAVHFRILEFVYCVYLEWSNIWHHM